LASAQAGTGIALPPRWRDTHIDQATNGDESMLKMIAAAALMLAAGGAAAQTAAAPQCAGKLVTIRLSEIKPGQIALFKKAVADHQAWYVARKNRTKVAYVRLGTQSGYDDSMAMTIVTYDSQPQPARDAAYASFVKEYQDSSQIKDEHRGCMN